MISDINEIQFPKLGWEFHIDPTAFTIFGISIQWYGIIITLGLVLASLYCFPKMKRFGIDSDKAVEVVLFGVIGGIIGARVYYVIWKWSEYQRDSFGETLKAMINTRNGGLAIYGGIIGAILAGYIVCRIRKIKALPMLDITVIGFLIGQGIGRWGNFVNQEAFGSTTDFFLGMTGGRIQQTVGELGLAADQPVHPCFLYESVWCLLGFVLLAAYSKRRKYDGQITLMYLSWYGAERFIVEGLRTDSLMFGSIRVSQALSAVIFVASVILQIVIGFRVKRDPESFVLYANTEESRMLIEEARRKSMGKGMDMRIDDDDEIGILPDDDDEDEIGILPDEEDSEIQDEADDEEDSEDSEESEVSDDSDDSNEVSENEEEDSVNAEENPEEAKNEEEDSANAEENPEEAKNEEEDSVNAEENPEEAENEEDNPENSEENPEEDINKEEK